jgi:hypothetical protein
MLRIILKQTLEIDEELSACFIDWQKAFGRVNWTKLMQILKEIVIDWWKRRLIRNLYMAQSVKVRLNRGETRRMKIGREVRQGCCLSPILFNLYSEYITKESIPQTGFEPAIIGSELTQNYDLGRAVTRINCVETSYNKFQWIRSSNIGEYV